MVKARLFYIVTGEFGKPIPVAVPQAFTVGSGLFIKDLLSGKGII
jgi:hypothetical protein